MKFNLEGKTVLNVTLIDTATEENKDKTFHWDEAGLPWTTLLDSFVGFLSDYYGYPLWEDVAIRRNPCRVTSGWRGEYFGKAKDSEIEMHQQLDLFDEYDAGSYGGTSDE